MLELFETMSQCFVELKIVIANCLFNVTWNLHVRLCPCTTFYHASTETSYTHYYFQITLSTLLLFLIFYYCQFNVWAFCWTHMVTNHLNELLSHFNSNFSAYFFYLRLYFNFGFWPFKIIICPCFQVGKIPHVGI